MCSVIEIKNANEYYIHYHSPESMVTPASENSESSLKMDNNKKEAINNEANEAATETTKLVKGSKDQEVTSDRGSSASPSLEDEDEQRGKPQEMASEANNKQSSISPSKIPVLRSSKKSPAPQPPTIAPKPKPPVKSKNPFEVDEAVSDLEAASSDPQGKKRSKSALPRPSPPRNLTGKNKLTSARSCESVPITVNSHIPASPQRPGFFGLNSKKRVTSEMATQVEQDNGANTTKKSASEENLANLEVKAKKPNLFKKVSESSDPICATTGSKWSYTNGAITTDLRQYLNTRFPKGGVDHELQNTIRDNLYLRTVPVTTRSPRPEERHGVDYTFLSKEEFIALEKSGELLESGVFDGNHYGTPKPSKDSGRVDPGGGSVTNSSGSNGPTTNVNFPGAHPSSEGKRRRNRSNVEAMTAKHLQDDDSKDDLNHHGTTPETPSGSTSTTKSGGSGHQAADSGHPDSPEVPEVTESGSHPETGSHLPDHQFDGSDPLGPLPPNWEKAYTDKGEPYFIDHNSGTSHWLDPRLSRVQKKRPEECSDDELPFGWERIDDPHYGTYFIDHVNRKTQYENPVLVAKAANQSADAIMTSTGMDYTGMGPLGPPPTGSAPPGHPGTFPRGAKKQQSPFFTRDPTQLRGEKIQTTLVKSMQGLGFTIVGGDDNVEEFLQIKSVVPNGPAWLDGRLKTGDVLVYVNDTCVLGFTHHDMVTMFQSISSGEAVNLEVCRGYPLPFDPDDPNTEIVTTVAVTSPGQNEWATELERQRNQSDAMSMPDLSNPHHMTTMNYNRPSSADLLGSGGSGPGLPDSENVMTIPITKGGMGFGFTIADSQFGQKVKKILDRPRCKNLQEGDVLIEINGKSVRGMSHSEVVQVLKECTRGSEANITIQRGLLPPGNSGSSPTKSKFKKGDSGSGLLKPKSGFLFRSKTPTAELYATQEREKVPNRPKTPLVNMSVSSVTSRSKTPTSMQQQPFQRNDITRASLGGQFPGQQNPADSYNPYNALSDRMASGLNLYDNYNRARSPGRELDNYYNPGQPAAGQQPGNNYYNEYAGYADQFADYQQHPPMNYYNGYPEDPGYGYTTGSRGPGYSPPSQQQQQQQPYRAGSLPRSVRKESTSFEHSEPLPGNMSRWPLDATAAGRRPGESFVELTVTLQRHDSGFGFRIVGGTEEGSQVSIGHIVPGGAADLDGRLFSGDEIIAVDNVSVLNSSHHQVVGLMGQAAQNGRVTLTVRRRMYQPQDYGQSRPTEYPYDVTVTRRENEGFGFVIISSASRAGSTIGRIITGSPAERCGRLHIGDRILAVNRVDISTLHHGDIVNLIKDSGYSVVLTVGPPLDEISSNASTSHREDHELNMLEMDEQYYAVELGRGARGFGFSIRGGREFHNMPLFVLRIAVDGPAAADGRLRVGDQIVEINGVNTKDMTHAEAIELIKSGGNMVRLLVKRGKVPPAAIMDNMGISPLSPTPLPSSSGGIPTSMTSNQGRPISAMSQPVTASGYMLPQGAMPLPGLTSNGTVPNAYSNSNYNNPTSANNNAPGPNGHLNGPVSHSSPRVAPNFAGESYYWNQY